MLPAELGRGQACLRLLQNSCSSLCRVTRILCRSCSSFGLTFYVVHVLGVRQFDLEFEGERLSFAGHGLIRRAEPDERRLGVEISDIDESCQEWAFGLIADDSGSSCHAHPSRPRQHRRRRNEATTSFMTRLRILPTRSHPLRLRPALLWRRWRCSVISSYKDRVFRSVFKRFPS
jgi:hypothetical protein